MSVVDIAAAKFMEDGVDRRDAARLLKLDEDVADNGLPSSAGRPIAFAALMISAACTQMSLGTTTSAVHKGS